MMASRALSGPVSLRGQVASALRSPSVACAESDTAEPFRNVAEKLKHPRLNLAEARAVLRRHAKTVIYGAFPARSRHQTCMDAAYACGTSPDTILRLLEGETAHPDALVLGYCAGVYRDRTGIVSPILAAITQIIAAGEAP